MELKMSISTPPLTEMIQITRLLSPPPPPEIVPISRLPTTPAPPERTVSSCIAEALGIRPVPVPMENSPPTLAGRVTLHCPVPLLIPTPEEAEDWIRFYDRLPFDFKPTFQGTPLEQAQEIVTWLQGPGNEAVLGCTSLDLSEAELSSYPRLLSLFRNLENLDLTMNQLRTIPPEIAQLQALECLVLDDNALTMLPPEIRELHLLEELHIANNQLTAFPEQILQMSCDMIITAWNNPFEPAYLEQFFQGLRHHQQTHPDEGPSIVLNELDKKETIAERLQIWSQEYQQAFPFCKPWCSRTADLTPLTCLEGIDAHNFHKFLRRIREMADYTVEYDDTIDEMPVRKKNIIRRVEAMVELACINPDFKKKMLAILEIGSNSCGDRVTLLFNEIEIEWQLHHANLLDEQFIPMAQQASLYYQLQKHALQVAEQYHLQDEIETVLGFHLFLRKQLHLPISTETMLYTNASGVTDAMLKNAMTAMRSFTNTQLLELSTHWQERMRKRHAQEAEVVQEKFVNLLDAAQEYFSIEKPEERITWLATLTNDAIRQFLLNLTAKSYDEAVLVIMQMQEQATAQLGQRQNKRKRS
jgi:hypothetical protein